MDSVDYASWACRTVQSWWRLCPFFSVLQKLKAVNVWDILLWVSSSFSSAHFLQFVVALWLAWGYRNLLLHGESVPIEAEVWLRARLLLADFFEPLASSNFSPQFPQVLLSLLKPPTLGFKIDMDAATNSADNNFGVGVVVRDSQGVLVCTTALFFPFFFCLFFCFWKWLKLGPSLKMFCLLVLGVLLL
ncbi:hypothetical protein ACOSP7_030817 [Xanthoceras sorbifolium]